MMFHLTAKTDAIQFLLIQQKRQRREGTYLDFPAHQQQQDYQKHGAENSPKALEQREADRQTFPANRPWI